MENARVDTDTQVLPLSPAAFMRRHRPELYSDTIDRPLYVLDRSMLEFQLETLTTRNEHLKFEIFCRKLCARALCPDIRPQSGPEGGGDGKVDADTYPVAEAISERYYRGNEKPEGETWGFAFSAKKDWKQKVVSDVRGIAGSGRHFDLIYFVTNQPARAADRSRIEAELGAAHGMTVRILDRAWIAEEVIDKERKDLAYDYLGVGQVVSDPMRLGPEDYSRRHRLEAIERALADPESFQGIERQMVTEAMVAAQLSRSADCPRHETDGRHARAIRLAKRYGTERQQIEARHDALWTAFWWFDDAITVSDGYAGIETAALAADHARNVEYLVQIHQLLVNVVLYRMLSADEVQFGVRSDRLEAVLERMALDRHRPNHQLEARTSLAIVRLGRHIVEGRIDSLTGIWAELGEILDQAEGLAEFDADRLIRLIEVTAPVARKDPTYRALAEKLADFVSRRSSDVAGALILLGQATHLGEDERFEAIRLLGRAARRLAKHEHAEQLVDAHQRLAFAYRGADLLWAARSSILFAAAGLAAEGEESSDLPAAFVPTVATWAWIALQLRLVPELLLAVRLMFLGLTRMPLDEPSKARVAEGIRELDVAFASNLLNMTEAELSVLTGLPDLLGDAGMSLSRATLLFALGHREVVEAEGGFPVSDAFDGVEHFMSLLKAQPVSRDLYGPLSLNPRDQIVVETVISGLTISIIGAGDDRSTLVAQAVGTTLEAVLATILEGRIAPHAEQYRIDIVLTDDAEPAIRTDPRSLRSMVSWPRTRSPAQIGGQSEVGQFLMQLVGEVLAAAFVMPDLKRTLEQLFAKGNAHDRVSSVLASLNCLQRLSGKDVIRLDTQDAADYPLRERPDLPDPDFSRAEKDVEPSPASARQDGPPAITGHRQVKVRSVIDFHAWNEAGWTGILYAGFGPEVPPVFALSFRNADAARHIFERWRERFGEADMNHEISISIIRRLPDHPPTHYAVQITSGAPDESPGSDALLQVMNRVHVMEPDNSRNLEQFLASMRRFGCFLLACSVITNGKTDIETDLVILKQAINVVDAADVSEHDIEQVALDLIARRDAG